MTPTIVPSALAVDFTRLGEQCRALEQAGADRIQWDVMDGQFVPNISFGPDVIRACRSVVDCVFEAHLMCNRPEELIPRYVEAGCTYVIVHPETLRQPHATYTQIRELGAKAGVALAPASPLALIEDVLDVIDQLLIMTVSPGFGGQSYLPTMESKIARARQLMQQQGHETDIEVDGGIGPDTVAGAARAGANVFVSGSALWRYDDLAAGVADLRSKAERAWRAGAQLPSD